MQSRNDQREEGHELFDRYTSQFWGDTNKRKMPTKFNENFRKSASSFVSSTERVGSSPEFIRSKWTNLRNDIGKANSVHGQMSDRTRIYREEADRTLIWPGIP